VGAKRFYLETYCLVHIPTEQAFWSDPIHVHMVILLSGGIWRCNGKTIIERSQKSKYTFVYLFLWAMAVTLCLAYLDLDHWQCGWTLSVFTSGQYPKGPLLVPRDIIGPENCQLLGQPIRRLARDLYRTQCVEGEGLGVGDWQELLNSTSIHHFEEKCYHWSFHRK
jgi:hypothetical protein